MEELLANKKLQLQKHPGKGGWTYLEVPGINRKNRRRFGRVTVKGTLDGYKLNNFILWPMKNGSMFMPVKAEIRKKISKQEGDRVHVVLYLDEGSPELPADFEACLKDEPRAGKKYFALSPEEQRNLCKWLTKSASETVKVERMANAIDSLLNNTKLKMK